MPNDLNATAPKVWPEIEISCSAPEDQIWNAAAVAVERLVGQFT